MALIKAYFVENGFLNSITSSFELPENLAIGYENYSILAETLSVVSPKVWFSGITFNEIQE